ncbi:DUF397 domain-containing protein [Streptosporangium sp. NPDC049248]|uniref:DUF397 domain-containing protein n=1 Tax=Streptosporangium sp. NPDC049248 TaxID=3155651 RepID=UPI003423117A
MWRKSSLSGDNGGQCVEVAANLPGAVAARHRRASVTGAAHPALAHASGEHDGSSAPRHRERQGPTLRFR